MGANTVPENFCVLLLVSSPPPPNRCHAALLRRRKKRREREKEKDKKVKRDEEEHCGPLLFWVGCQVDLLPLFCLSLPVRTFLFWLREQACFFRICTRVWEIEIDEVYADFAAQGGTDFRPDPPPSGFRGLVSKIRQLIGVVRNV